jgi:hypothetical protein
LRSQSIRRVERVARFGEHHARASLRRELRRGNAAARGADHHNPTTAHREASPIHTITEASAL